MSIFEEKESNVRSYCRKYPVVFTKAKNAKIYDKNGNEYIDFLAVAGSMNYGHNNSYIKSRIMEYLNDDNIINALDMYTEAKELFLEKFNEEILLPRKLNYKVMCCGSTGTNAVEAALKLARKNTNRTGIFAFSGAFHGMSLGSLACTTDGTSRKGAGVSLSNVTFIPYENDKFDSIGYIRTILEDDHSGVELPAAMILETVQAEGGINVASVEWLKEIRKICDEYKILLIVDDIQVGNGRTGHFFSFERANIVPDFVVLSKSISGFGLPMSLLLIKPEFDIFKPAEHNGTFRGNQLGFVGSVAGIEYYNNANIEAEVLRKEKIVRNFLEKEIKQIDKRIKIRGIGLIWGIDFSGISNRLALEIVHDAFDNKMIIEVAGRGDSVLKIFPPLTIEDELLIKGLELLKGCIHRRLGT